MNKNVFAHTYEVSAKERSQLKGHKGLVLWFTGLSGSGKSTIANALEKQLVAQKIHTYTLDGDNVRKGLNNNLAFSPEDRVENIRRIAEVSKLMLDAGLLVLSAFVSPYSKDREGVRSAVGAENFIEIYINTPLSVCEKRDVKGLYAKARKGEIKDFTGISAPYEAPINPDIEIKTEELTIDESVAKILKNIEQKLAF
ncbi:adenylyl-sulfate kinase [Patiriisocius sp. Uisw_047]|jgi:adenylylsulfate kinase|uniref:adenylyl-sulfate kinase n=1 Tax=Patiriisocius sp. Uisw_047 TaxID=3230969 RepID=UPI0039E82D13